MNTNLAIALLLLLSFTAGACVIEERKNQTVGAPELETELKELKRAHKKGELDEKEFEAKREMLVTVWELKVRDQQPR